MKATIFVEEFLFSLIVLSLVFGLAIPNSDHHKSRVLDPLAEDDHYVGEDHEHNRVYDHKAFLGGEEAAEEFDELSPEESKHRLAIMVTKIDKNSDGFVTTEELKEWIHISQKKYIIDDLNRQWSTQTGEDATKNSISWDEYKRRTFGFLDTNAAEEESKTYQEMLRRDERRWRLSDRDGDNALTKEEFLDFLHPEESERTRDVVVDETLEDIDKNGDGKVSVDEYISDMYSPDATGDQVPDWVLREKQQFHDMRDKNKDGFMDREEIREWIIPSDYDHSEAEAKHLILEADSDKDGKLSSEEIVNSYDVFVGSQATDFGDALLRHDEF